MRKTVQGEYGSVVVSTDNSDGNGKICLGTDWAAFYSVDEVKALIDMLHQAIEEVSVENYYDLPPGSYLKSRNRLSKYVKLNDGIWYYFTLAGDLRKSKTRPEDFTSTFFERIL